MKPFRYLEELDAFVITEEFDHLAADLGLTEWHAAVWIGRLLAMDNDYGEHIFDNWNEREARERATHAQGIDTHGLMIVVPDRFQDGRDGPCNSPQVRKAFWTDVFRSLDLTEETIEAAARLHNDRLDRMGSDDFYQTWRDASRFVGRNSRMIGARTSILASEATMKATLSLLVVAVATFGFAQNSYKGSPAGASSSTRMADKAIMSAMTELKAGKKVKITVDNRSVPYTPMLMGKLVYVPVRFFQETGLDVVWDKGDKRATVRDQNGVSKNSIQYDASKVAKSQMPSASMRPMFKSGTLYVPLASGLAAFGFVAEWVPADNRINVKSNRPGT